MAETSGKDHADEAARAARITSARSDFVSSLSRRVQELRTCLVGLEQDPGSPRQRDDLRRRVHALTAGARLLRFGSMATALAEVERTLERAAAVGEIERDELRAISETLEGLHALAWNEPTNEQRPTERPPVAAPIGEGAKVPPTVLVVGSSGIADAVTLPIDHAAENDIECERTETAASALDLARALAPDVAVIDADLTGAKELIEKLARDPLTEPMPVIVVGTWSTPEEAGSWIAGGAARALSKPISPHELRSACVELSSGRDENLYYRPLGETTVDDLTQRIIAEIKRGLPEALVTGRATPIALGDGSDILAAVWGAVARVRDLVTIKSGGGVRFSQRGPEGALPFAPWWGEGIAPERRAAPNRSGSEPPRKAEGEPRLDGRRIVVADDDPAVTWFIGGVLRSAGADVREAHDGDRALELCFRISPDLVISDVLMPGLDGFALCRALKRDIALRDVPVILLSWKEDLLQRLRDLGADADGYMRKEASAASLLQRVQEVLRPRARIEARLAENSEVRGRLDGVTPRTLLHITSRVRPDARLRVRDASFLYELEMRGGAPKSATRTTSDGSFQRGKEVFAALLGVRAGRFVVTQADRASRGTLEGGPRSPIGGAPRARPRGAQGAGGNAAARGPSRDHRHRSGRRLYVGHPRAGADAGEPPRARCVSTRIDPRERGSPGAARGGAVRSRDARRGRGGAWFGGRGSAGPRSGARARIDSPRGHPLGSPRSAVRARGASHPRRAPQRRAERTDDGPRVARLEPRGACSAGFGFEPQSRSGLRVRPSRRPRIGRRDAGDPRFRPGPVDPGRRSRDRGSRACRQ